MRPSLQLIKILGAWLFISAVLILFQPVVWLWPALSIGLAIVVTFDFFECRKSGLPIVRRKLPHSLSLDIPVEVELYIRAGSDCSSRLDFYDHHPPNFQTTDLPQILILPEEREGREFRIRYMATPLERGRALFGKTACLTASPFGLWQRHLFTGSEETVRVYPNFRTVMGYNLFAIEGKVGQIGIRKRQRRGQGLEFHELREYRAGDSIRFIDWKATSKHRKAISRDYQEEQDQQVVFLLDCGFRMRTKDDELSHFDHALNALLLLSYIALKQGDSVGLLAYGGSKRWLAPLKGVSMVNRLLNTIYDLETSVIPSDMARAMEDLLTRLRRRSLIILMSNIREEDTDDLLSIMNVARRKHLVLAASLREKVLTETTDLPVRDFDEALKLASVYHYLEIRRETQDRLRAAGLLYFDETPNRLPAALVNRYLDIKMKGLL